MGNFSRFTRFNGRAKGSKRENPLESCSIEDFAFNQSILERADRPVRRKMISPKEVFQRTCRHQLIELFSKSPA